MGLLVSENLRTIICQQIAHEQYNANLYLYICGYLKNKGLDNIANKFEEQYKEESSHAKEFFDLLTDLSAEVHLPLVDEVILPITTIMDIANTYVQREILTTRSINEIKKLAIEEDNPVVEEFMRHMISLQQKEYEESTSFLDKMTLLPEWYQVMLYDASLGQ